MTRYRIWLERALPAGFEDLVESCVELAGPATATPGNPLVDLPGAQAVIASAKIKYDGTFFDQFPTLLAICRTGIGVDNVVISDATARGIAVCNTPDAVTASTAEHAVGLMLAVAKEFRRTSDDLRSGRLKDFFTASMSLELYGLAIGLVGFGRIGKHVARICQGMGMRVLAFDPLLTDETAAELRVSRILELADLLRAADVVSLHVPATPQTRRLINAERLALMKRGSILVNAARGALVDERALLDALESGHLRGAGLDVFDPEPPPADHPLLARTDVIATPHVAGVTTSSRRRAWTEALAQALDVLRGRRPTNLLNPEMWPPTGAR